ncbi:MAG: histidine--tRNA ligase [Candidatus Pacebacteria bacterium]|nr:histidine--tRNA ligase [Candidatus Paceibacterota bacterium]
MNNISNQPPKGTSDWLPEEFAIRLYIFKTWIKVCQSYGFDRYLTPLFENADIYRAKSGEDVGVKELMLLTDRAGREFALRPEMTPSVTRLVSRIFDKYPKPLRLFSVANFIRNEKPQRGRNREFWQLNCDIFGSSSLEADKEILQLAIDIMLAFKAPKDSFVLSLNHRKLVDDLLSLANIQPEARIPVIRLMDKWNKLKEEELETAFKDLNVSSNSYKMIETFMKSQHLSDIAKFLPKLKDSQGFKEIDEIISSMIDTEYSTWVRFNSQVIRGLDYYDGIIFEIFDKHPDNRRAMFGGGRYNGLAEIFGQKSFPAVGFAPGDETTKLFLESWGLLESIERPGKYYFPLLSNDLKIPFNLLLKKLRKDKNIEAGLEEQKINKALSYANAKKVDKVIIMGEEEYKNKEYKIKDMETGKEETFKV